MPNPQVGEAEGTFECITQDQHDQYSNSPTQITTTTTAIIIMTINGCFDVLFDFRRAYQET